MPKTQYQKQWTIPSGSNPDKSYTVSLTMTGTYQCSCPRWVFKREQCSHILLAQSGKYENIEPPSEEQRGDTLLQQYAKKGYRYYTWFPEPMQSWDRQKLEAIKRNPNHADVKTFVVWQSRRFVIVKEKPEVYQQEIDSFVKRISSINWRTVKQRKELKEAFNKHYFSLTQHVIFNNTGVINPNLPEGSVYTSGSFGKQLHRISMRYKWLR